MNFLSLFELCPCACKGTVSEGAGPRLWSLWTVVVGQPVSRAQLELRGTGGHDQVSGDTSDWAAG